MENVCTGSDPRRKTIGDAVVFFIIVHQHPLSINFGPVSQASHTTRIAKIVVDPKGDSARFGQYWRKSLCSDGWWNRVNFDTKLSKGADIRFKAPIRLPFSSVIGYPAIAVAIGNECFVPE